MIKKYGEHAPWCKIHFGGQYGCDCWDSPHQPEVPEDTNPKAALGALKAPMSSCPNTALIELNAVMGGGAHKYGAYNFRETKIDAMTYIGAIRRHLFLWEDGVDVDEESERSHLAHIMACCALALDAQHTGMFVDNRSKTGLVSGLLKDCAETHNKFVEKNLSVEARAAGSPVKERVQELQREIVEAAKVIDKQEGPLYLKTTNIKIIEEAIDKHKAALRSFEEKYGIQEEVRHSLGYPMIGDCDV